MSKTVLIYCSIIQYISSFLIMGSRVRSSPSRQRGCIKS